VTAPREVLDTQQSLYAALQYPPPGPVQFFNELFDGLKDMMGRRDAGRWVTASFISMFFPATSGADFLQCVRRPLYAAPAYQVAGDIVAAVTGMYDKTADESGTMLLAEELPSPAGFLWLDEPAVLTDAGGVSLATRALSWGPQPAPWGNGETLKDGIRLTSWSSNPGDSYYPAAASGELPLVLQHSQFVPFGQQLVRATGSFETGSITVHAGKSPDDLLHWVHTLWMFMGTEVVAAERPHVERPYRRRAQRVVGNETVNVVLLRRVRHGGAEVVHRDIDWGCRWVVQSHFRHLEDYSATAERHHAVSLGGDRCAVCGTRITRVRAYVKGPDGLPLKAVPETVYRVAR
jgi:hypothetical protein